MKTDLLEQPMVWMWMRSSWMWIRSSSIRVHWKKKIHGWISLIFRKAVVLQPWAMIRCEIEEESLWFLDWNNSALIILTSAPRSTLQRLSMKLFFLFLSDFKSLHHRDKVWSLVGFFVWLFYTNFILAVYLLYAHECVSIKKKQTFLKTISFMNINYLRNIEKSEISSCS